MSNLISYESAQIWETKDNESKIALTFTPKITEADPTKPYNGYGKNSNVKLKLFEVKGKKNVEFRLDLSDIDSLLKVSDFAILGKLPNPWRYKDKVSNYTDKDTGAQVKACFRIGRSNMRQGCQVNDPWTLQIIKQENKGNSQKCEDLVIHFNDLQFKDALFKTENCIKILMDQNKAPIIEANREFVKKYKKS